MPLGHQREQQSWFDAQRSPRAKQACPLFAVTTPGPGELEHATTPTTKTTVGPNFRMHVWIVIVSLRAPFAPPGRTVVVHGAGHAAREVRRSGGTRGAGNNCGNFVAHARGPGRKVRTYGRRADQYPEAEQVRKSLSISRAFRRRRRRESEGRGRRGHHQARL